jgi:hypothetical protein
MRPPGRSSNAPEWNDCFDNHTLPISSVRSLIPKRAIELVGHGIHQIAETVRGRAVIIIRFACRR